jgi:hypothetical protein
MNKPKVIKPYNPKEKVKEEYKPRYKWFNAITNEIFYSDFTEITFNSLLIYQIK